MWGQRKLANGRFGLGKIVRLDPFYRIGLCLAGPNFCPREFLFQFFGQLFQGETLAGIMPQQDQLDAGRLRFQTGMKTCLTSHQGFASELPGGCQERTATATGKSDLLDRLLELTD